ncbi:uncharacterized protein IWZ02DRAFT_87031 [Phyllosticta citriasiana]|uniref:Secreted protein n=1 Tax=Phyllosticta citriasiana TaxID=595635 RepID=A0ABR1L1Y7_9PEZI
MTKDYHSPSNFFFSLLSKIVLLLSFLDTAVPGLCLFRCRQPSLSSLHSCLQFQMQVVNVTCESFSQSPPFPRPNFLVSTVSKRPLHRTTVRQWSAPGAVRLWHKARDQPIAFRCFLDEPHCLSGRAAATAFPPSVHSLSHLPPRNRHLAKYQQPKRRQCSRRVELSENLGERGANVNLNASSSFFFSSSSSCSSRGCCCRWWWIRVPTGATRRQAATAALGLPRGQR